MLLVIDANIVFGALLKPSGVTGELLFSPRLEFISPEFLEDELFKYFSEMVLKSKRPEEDMLKMLDLILSRIKILPENEYEPFLAKAKEISPDPKDAEYFAVALAFACPLWSNDKRLKSQSEVKVLSTIELLQLLSPRN